MPKKLLVFVPLVLLVLVTASHVYLFIAHLRLRVELVHAEDQIQVFRQSRNDAVGAAPHEIQAHIRYVEAYYPSDTKQQTGTRLDNIVEAVRADCLRDMQLRLQDTIH